MNGYTQGADIINKIPWTPINRERKRETHNTQRNSSSTVIVKIGPSNRTNDSSSHSFVRSKEERRRTVLRSTTYSKNSKLESSLKK